MYNNFNLALHKQFYINYYFLEQNYFVFTNLNNPLEVFHFHLNLNFSYQEFSYYHQFDYNLILQIINILPYYNNIYFLQKMLNQHI